MLYFLTIVMIILLKKTVEEAVKRGVNLSYADLGFTDLRDVYLGGADLRSANLQHVNLSGADLRLANLSYANLNGAKIDYPMNIPDGEFIAWKKIYRKRQKDYVIVKLKILADSKRSRATSDKCRCDKALVLGFETLEGESLKRTKQVTNYNYEKCTYKVGEIIYPDEWDDNRWNECSHGIHFFIDRQSAVEHVIIH